MHSQGETLNSFDQAQQRSLLDRFGAINTDAVAEAFAAWRATTDKMNELQSAEQDRLRMADLWRFQSKEIEQAALTTEDEDVQLEAEKRVLANAEKLYTAAMSAHELLYESEGSAEGALGAALKHLDELARYDARFQEPAQQLLRQRRLLKMSTPRCATSPTTSTQRRDGSKRLKTDWPCLTG
ncbi:MAG: hypothetical protein WDN23_16425 [Edaphobacter sp.]